MSDPLINSVLQAYNDRSPRARTEQLKWVMDRPSYDRIRALSVTEEQEKMRARGHASLLISDSDSPPWHCPVCYSASFESRKALTDHIVRMSDPKYREPSPNDLLLEFPIVVREDGGAPHLELVTDG